MAGLATALVNLAANQKLGSVTIDDKLYEVNTVVTGALPGKSAPGSGIWVQNLWQFPQQDDFIAQEVHRYDIAMQWFVGKLSVGGRNLSLVTEALWENWLNIWIADQRIAAQTGTASVVSSIMLGGDALLEFNGEQYYGIDAILSCQIERNTSA